MGEGPLLVSTTKSRARLVLLQAGQHAEAVARGLNTMASASLPTRTCAKRTKSQGQVASQVLKMRARSGVWGRWM